MANSIKCTCGHSWSKTSSSKKDMYVCHICGKDNTMEDGGWLNKYNDGGPMQENYNDASTSTDFGFVGLGYDINGRNYSPAWGGQFQDGGYMQKAKSFPVIDDIEKIGKDGSKVPDWEAMAKQAKKIGAKQVRTKSGATIVFDNNWKATGGTDPDPELATLQMGGSLPGSVGFTYARTQDPAPSNGPYAKKTMASAQDGIQKVKANTDEATNFLKDWYTKRKEIPEHKYVAESNLENLNNFKVKNVSEKDLDKEKAGAFYDPNTKEISVNPNDEFSSSVPTLIHEISHHLRSKNPWQGQRAILEKSIDPTATFLHRSEDVGHGKEYMSKQAPEELHSRLNEFRYNFKLDPTKKYTEEEAKAFMTTPEANEKETLQDYKKRLDEYSEKWDRSEELFNLIKEDPKKLAGLLNGIAANKSTTPLTQAQNGKEMKFYQEGLDFKPKSISQNGVKTDKKPKKSKPEVSPYVPIDVSNANIIRGLFPAPLNVSQAVAKNFAGDSRLNETSLNDDQKLVLWNTIQNARKRSGKQTGGGTEYSDYGNQGYGKGEEFDNWFNRGKIGAVSGIYNSLTNPGFVMASTVGRGRYWTDPKNPDDINYTDVYDWNTHEKNYKGSNAYQKIRNLVRGNEDKNLDKSKNDKNRMNIRLTKKEIDAIKEREEMKLSSLIAFDKGGVIKDDMGQWAHPGEITEIGSNDITMQGVDYPVLGVSDTGDTKMMQPGKDYKFKGKKVTEYPMAQGGKKLKGKPTVKEIMEMPMPVEERYEPSKGVKNLKATLSGIDLATLPFIETPLGFVANKAAGIANSVGDLYTSARYAADGQWGNAGIDAVEALLDLVPFAKGKRTYNLTKGSNLPPIYNKLSKVDKSLNRGLGVLKAGAYGDDFQDVIPESYKRKKQNGGWLNKYK